MIHPALTVDIHTFNIPEVYLMHFSVSRYCLTLLNAPGVSKIHNYILSFVRFLYNCTGFSKKRLS
jgi:hypothetical protein